MLKLPIKYWKKCKRKKNIVIFVIFIACIICRLSESQTAISKIRFDSNLNNFITCPWGTSWLSSVRSMRTLWGWLHI